MTPRKKQSCLEDVDSIYISCCQPLFYLKNVKGAKAHFFVRFIRSYVQSVKRLLLTSAIISPCWHLTTTLLPTIPRWAKGPNCAYFKDVLALLCRRHGIPHLLQNSKDLSVRRSQVQLQMGFISDVHLGPGIEWHTLAATELSINTVSSKIDCTGKPPHKLHCKASPDTWHGPMIAQGVQVWHEFAHNHRFIWVKYHIFVATWNTWGENAVPSKTPIRVATLVRLRWNLAKLPHHSHFTKD